MTWVWDLIFGLHNKFICNVFFVCEFPTFTKASLLWTPFRHAFPGMLLKSFNKLAGRVLSGIEQLSFASSSWLYTPIKPSRSFIERYKKDHKFRPLSGFVYCFRSFVNANIYKSKKKLSVICFNKREWSKRGNRPYMTLFP